MATLQNKIPETVASTTSSPTSARVVSLHARPMFVCNLSFPVDGVVDEVNCMLGGTLTNYFAYDNLLAKMGAIPAPTVGGVGGDPSRLFYDSQQISLAVAGEVVAPLMTLRSSQGAAMTALEQAINARQNAYWARYSNIAYRVQTAQRFYW